MLDVINSLDPQFFASVMREYDLFQHSRAKEDKKLIVIDMSLYEMLNNIENNFQSKTAKAIAPRFHLPVKKRKRREKQAEMPELKTAFSMSSNPFKQQRYIGKFYTMD